MMFNGRIYFIRKHVRCRKSWKIDLWLSRRDPAANGNDALFHAGFRLQASERNIKGLEFCFHSNIFLADVMTLISG